MATTLVVNPGSTSKKYALYENNQVLFSMRFEETGNGYGLCRQKNKEQQKCTEIEASIYKKAIEYFIQGAIDDKVITSAHDIKIIGIRVVAPGDKFAQHKKITDSYIQDLERLEKIIPLHIPAILAEIYAVKAIITNVPIFGISDSAFHSSIPKHRTAIGIDKKDADEFNLKRFGYHGLSMSSIVKRTGSFFGVAPDRIVVCHVGGGVSVTALHYTESVDTSMGYSPASGVVMGSRVGSFGADALLALMAHKKSNDIDKFSYYINNQSGFKGLTGYSDLRLVLNRYTEGDCDAALALEMFRYQIHRSVGGHIAILGGIDALVFTGTAVIRNPFLRSFILSGLESFGFVLDQERNDVLIGNEGMIHSDRSAISIGVMKNDEMREIASLAQQLTNQ